MIHSKKHDPNLRDQQNVLNGRNFKRKYFLDEQNVLNKIMIILIFRLGNHFLERIIIF